MFISWTNLTTLRSKTFSSSNDSSFLKKQGILLRRRLYFNCGICARSLSWTQKSFNVLGTVYTLLWKLFFNTFCSISKQWKKLSWWVFFFKFCFFFYLSDDPVPVEVVDPEGPLQLFVLSTVEQGRQGHQHILERLTKCSRIEKIEIMLMILHNFNKNYLIALWHNLCWNVQDKNVLVKFGIFYMGRQVLFPEKKPVDRILVAKLLTKTILSFETNFKFSTFSFW